MKILSCQLNNFASYETLDFEFKGQGLTLIHGPTGAGKSTLADAIPWVLFGRTAKGGAVNEVLSWPGDKVTEGKCIVDDTANGPIQVTRIRGPQAKDNDLFFTIMSYNGAVDRRGKDIPDTQRLINQFLGLNADLYLSAAYFHEFSQTSQFFTTTAKNRRATCEQLVDLSLPKSLQEKLTLKRKETQSDKTNTESSLNADVRNLEIIERHQTSAKKMAEEFEQTRANKLAALYQRADNFDRDKDQRVKELIKLRDTYEEARRQEHLVATMEVEEAAVNIKPEWYFTKAEREIANRRKNISNLICEHCGSKLHHKDNEELQAAIHLLDLERMANNQASRVYNAYLTKKRDTDTVGNPYYAQLKTLESSINNYLEQIGDLENQKNPHLDSVHDLSAEIIVTKDDIENTKAILAGLTEGLVDVELLLDVVADFRSALIKNTIVDLENKTNELLTKHFDAEIRVEFEVQDADKLEVSITKDGNQATFTQLSKGQRQLLKLCFGVSVMRCVSNHHGISLNTAWFDESMDGMSDEFKMKAFGLFEELALESESVFVVEHSEMIKTAFGNAYHVTLENGNSVIEKT